ncbi:unnamed protein product [Lathyrus sativus]|nr:unnamed protein product [Lathyrus sativus]
MHKAINCSLITLIPKSYEARTIKDMRPIACCSTTYKIISKNLTARLGKVIGNIIEETQSAFVLGRTIHDNIMLARELVRVYNGKHISLRCMIQLDIQKAYDTMEWLALTNIMQELGIPQTFINRTMACVSIISYRFSINGAPTDLINLGKGLDRVTPSIPYYL